MASNVSASITQAINFLTRPLALIYDPTTINALQSILRSTFHAALLASSTGKLIFSFTAAVPPRPVFAACIAVGIQWSEWVQLLGRREFDLVIDSHSVIVRYTSTKPFVPPQTITIWTQPKLTPTKRSLFARLALNDVPHVPISKLGQQSAMTHTPPSTTYCQSQIASSVLRSHSQGQTRTLAQQLLDSDHEEEEADELFAMISKSSIISPTPTKERFCLPSYTRTTISLPFTSMSPISSPELSSPESSRPSSRSSTFSTYSFTDNESLTSDSSISSMPTSAAIAKPLSSSSPIFTPSAVRRERVAPAVYIDPSKKEVTRYSYQGGVSNVLTGGVMLGAPAIAAAKPPALFSAPKYKAPIGGKKVPAQGQGSWRRGVAFTRF